MERKVSDLLNIVHEEIELYRDLIHHVRRKTALLVQGQTDAILKSNKIEETFNARLRGLETEMQSLCLDLCRVLGIPCEEFTLLRLADGTEQSVALKIRDQACLFKNLIEQLKCVNQRNIKLIEASAHYSRCLPELVSNSRQILQCGKPAVGAGWSER